MTKQTALKIEDFAQLLQIDLTLDAVTLDKRVRARMCSMKLADSCTRCGGCGEYSFNMMYGTVCFKCNGTGQQLPKRLTRKHFETVKAAVEAGELEKYLQFLCNRDIARKATDIVMNAWSSSEVSKLYRWDDFESEAHKLYSPLNKRMHDAYQTVSEYWRKHACTDKQLRAATAETMQQLATLVQEALAEIAAAKAEIDALRAQRGE